jgi:methyl-accepting chemotaxis protein
MSTPPVLQNPDPGDTYQALYDALGRAYWEASTVENKDLIHGAQESIGEILTAIDQQELAANTALFSQLTPKIKATNEALEKIQGQINNITRNINTAASVLSGIAKVLSLFPAI